jgi:hypothetical protein
MPPKAPPVTERGYVNPTGGIMSGWSQYGDQFETVGDLLWPRSIQTYTRMVRDDSRLSSILQAISLPIRLTTWRIDPAGASEEVTRHIADDLGLAIVGDDEQRPQRRAKGRFSWGSHLQQALTYLQFGHSLFERVYRVEDGRVHLRKLAPRPQSTIAWWNVARDGGLVSIEQWPAGLYATPGTTVATPGGARSSISGDRLLVYTRDPDPGVWQGNSILRPAYKNYILKDELLRIEAAAARRHGIGVPAAWAPPEESNDPEKVAEYQRAASAYQGGSSAGIGLPAEARFEILGPTGAPMDPRRAIEYHDHQMALVALAHFLNLDGKGGSYALASVQQNTFTQAVGAVADHIRETAQAHVVDDLVDWNWGQDEPAPRLVCDAIGSRQDATALALQQLVAAGLLTPDARTEMFVRQLTGLPAPDPDSDGDEDVAPDAEDGDDTDPAVTTDAPARQPTATAKELRLF